MHRIFKIAKYVLFITLGLVAIAICLGLSFRAYRQHVNEQTLAIHTPNGIQEGMYVHIGGIEQWLQIRGEDRNNPVLLFVHGGPGASTLAISSGWLPWEKYFTVVQWDERGTGHTYRKTGDAIAPTMTVEQMTEDGIEVAEFLRTHLHKSKVILVGHSWGSFLGIHMVKKRPDLFAAYVGTGQIIGQPTWEKRMAIQADRLHTLAQTANNTEALKELASVGTLQWDNDTRWNVLQKWARQLALPPVEHMSMSGPIPPPMMPDITLLDWYYFVCGYRFSEERLAGRNGPTQKADLRSLGLDFSIPIFFFEGTSDTSTPIEPVSQYFEQIIAPHKEYVRFEGADHFLPLNRPDSFLKELLDRVRPLADMSHKNAS